MTIDERAALQTDLDRTRGLLSDLCDLLVEANAPDVVLDDAAKAHAHICSASWSFEKWSRIQDRLPGWY